MQIDVVIPAFNAAATIARAIESARALKISTDIVVVDDGSTDLTAENARSAGARVVSQDNAGAAVARRVGISASGGSHVVLLDADDQLRPGLLSAISCLRDDPGLAVVGGRISSGARSVKHVQADRIQHFSTRDLLRSPVAPWPQSAGAWSRDMLVRAIDLDIPALEPGYAEDYELLIRGSLVGGVGAVSEITATYERGGGKSAVAAKKALESAVAVQTYYGERCAIGVAPWSAATITSHAAWRQYRGLVASDGFLWGTANAVRSPGAIPPLLSYCANALGRRLRSIGR